MIGKKSRPDINGVYGVRYLTTYVFANKKIGQLGTNFGP